MVKFAHISDVHLGGWKQQPLQDLNSKSFEMAIDTCIKQKLDFVPNLFINSTENWK